jgi:hypothetical protein
VLISGALTLLTNALIAYNTWKLHQVVERRRAAGKPVPANDILAHISPIGFRHINFHGVYQPVNIMVLRSRRVGAVTLRFGNAR